MVRQVLVDNPHTTLQVVLEPAGDPRHLTAEVLEILLAASHESLSYLDWFYSLHPIRLLGAKRLVVLLPAAMEESLDDAWLDEIEDRATIHWTGRWREDAGKREEVRIVGWDKLRGNLRSWVGTCARPTLPRAGYRAATVLAAAGRAEARVRSNASGAAI